MSAWRNGSAMVYETIGCGFKSRRRLIYVYVAQLAAQRPSKPEVAGSNPAMDLCPYIN